MSGALVFPLAFFRYDLASDGSDGLARIAKRLKGRGVRLAGVVQRDVARPGRRRCELRLEDLATGLAFSITADRGAQARGCRLDLAALAQAEMGVEKALALGADALIVNKFGKEEAQGRGLFPTIAEACAGNVPVLLGLARAYRVAALRLVREAAAEIVSEGEALEWLWARVSARSPIQCPGPALDAAP